MSLRTWVLRLEAAVEAIEPTRKLPTNWKPDVKAPMHHPMHNKVGASTTAPTRKVAAKDLPKGPGAQRARIKQKLRKGEKMVFGRVVKVK